MDIQLRKLKRFISDFDLVTYIDVKCFVSIYKWIPQNIMYHDVDVAKFVDTNEWTPIHTLPGFECCIEYYVNKLGQIKSTKGVVERILKHKISNNGYPTVNLTQRIGRKKLLTVPVHKLVAFAFLGNPPTPYGRTSGCSVVDHKDEDKLNCRADNLRWVSRKENNTKCAYNRRPKNTDEQNDAYKERQRISNREHMRRKRAKDKEAKIEESDN